MLLFKGDSITIECYVQGGEAHFSHLEQKLSLNDKARMNGNKFILE